MGTAIGLHRIGRRFGTQRVLADVDLEVAAGARQGLLGANGAGKTTTMRILATLLRPTMGKATVHGFDTARDPLAVRRLIGYVSDDGARCCPGWSAREYVRSFARLQGIAQPRSAAAQALQAVAVSPPLARRPLGQLSTGMRRRVELARAIVGQPRVLLLDEPTRGLDMVAKRETWALLRALNEQKGVTLLVSSHEALEIQQLCQDVAVLCEGRIVLRSSLQDLPSDAAALETRLSAALVAPREA